METDPKCFSVKSDFAINKNLRDLIFCSAMYRYIEYNEQLVFDVVRCSYFLKARRFMPSILHTCGV